MAWLKGGPTWPIFISTSPRPSRGGRQGASSGTASSGWLTRRRRVQGGVPHEVPMTQAMTTEARQALGGHWPAQCPCFLFGAKGESTDQGIRQRLPFRCNETKPAGRPDGGHRGAQDGVITSAFGSRRPPLVRITCTRCSPSKWPIVGALPAQYLGRGPGPLPINRTSHPQGKGERENWIE